MVDMLLHGEHGAAWRRRQRRLRSWWRHEQQSVAMALSAAAHHSKVAAGAKYDGLRAQTTDRAGEAANKAPRRQKSKAAGETVFFELFDEDTAGMWPGVLAEPRPQERVQRHTTEHIVDYVCCAPLVQTLDAPVPQKVEQLPDVLRFFDRFATDPEQVIAVPKIYTEDVPVRAVLRDPQLVEQLVEVPTTFSYAALLLWHAIHGSRPRTVEQNVDIPAVGGSGTGGGLSGFLPGQSYSMTAEQIVDNPVPRRGFDEGLQGFPPGQSSATSSEQTVDIPVPHGGRNDLSPSSEDFSNPPERKKVRRSLRTRVRECFGAPAHPS